MTTFCETIKYSPQRQGSSYIVIRILIGVGLCLIFSAGSVMADMTPMVEKHIFTSGKSREEAAVAPKVISGPIEKEIVFTGVIISPKGKFIIVTENDNKPKANKDHTDTKQVLKQGDQIKGMTIQEIGPNYVLLVDKDKATVKMNLYKGAKIRPAPPALPAEAKPEPKTPQNPPAGTEAATAPGAQPQTPPAQKELPSPFGGKDKTPQRPVAGEPGQNPFADLLNNAGSLRSPAGAPANPFNSLP